MFEVNRILGHREEENGTFSYLVRWESFGAEYDSWEPIKSFTNPSSVLHDYYYFYYKDLFAKEKQL